ncbi:hypothetical protein JCM8208_005294 [Rhodotorula glutinis]
MDAALVPVLVSLFHPHPRTLSLALPSSTPLSSLASLLAPYCPPAAQNLALSSGKPLSLSPSSTLASLDGATSSFVALRLTPRLPGGKGGFASQLRAQGGRMSSNKAQNTDSCRGLDGRRLSTLKEAKRLADALENEPDRLAKEALAKQKRLEELNVEIRRLEQQAGVSAAAAGPVASGSGVGSSGGAAQDGARPAPSAGGAGGAVGGKRRLDDAKYVEESKEIVSGVKDAVRAAMMKKRKKAKTDAAPAAPPPEKEKEKENKGKASAAKDKGKGKGKAIEADEDEAVETAAAEQEA